MLAKKNNNLTANIEKDFPILRNGFPDVLEDDFHTFQRQYIVIGYVMRFVG